MASQAVFSTVELLEKILLRLDTRNLLLSQRVCSSWKAVMDSSPRIQRALFYAPSGTWTTGSECQVNPLTKRLGVELSFCHLAHPGYGYPPDSMHECDEPHILLRARDGAVGPLRSQARAVPEPSWMNMFLCQPVYSKAVWEEDTTTDNNAKYGGMDAEWTWSSSSGIFKSDERGLTMGYLIGLLEMADD